MVSSKLELLLLNLTSLFIFQNVKHVWEEKTRKLKKNLNLELTASQWNHGNVIFSSWYLISLEETEWISARFIITR